MELKESRKHFRDVLIQYIPNIVRIVTNYVTSLLCVL